ncbi:hypothetical protein ACHHYP_11739 [Achlya hypogyna]|uniref:PH domain-containing protein n=1 Tax=Achlya hypogyna TaxID=1202772 RepID=A0A1V9YIJ0_ACHHY|nr:hypothetical protein ACHHYP_11739 [Achlya hypogyna]
MAESSVEGWSGYLLKQRSGSHSWHTRFAVLERGVLYIYAHRGDTYPRGIVLLGGVVLAQTPERKPNSFSIAHASTSHVLHCATSDTAALVTWITKLQAHAAIPTIPLVRRVSTLLKEFHHRPTELPKLWTESHVAVAPKYEYQIKSMMNDFAQHLFDSGRWQSVANSPDASLTVQTSSTAVLSRTTFDHPPPAILDALLSTTSMLQLDSQLSDLQVLSAVDPHTSVQYVCWKGHFPLPRKACVKLVHWRLLPDNSLVVVSRSLQSYPLPASLSLIEDVERASLQLEAFHIVPTADNAGAEVTYVLHTDTAGLPLDVIVALGAKLGRVRSAIAQARVAPIAKVSPPTAYADSIEAALKTLLGAFDAETNLWAPHGEREGVSVSSKPEGPLLAVRAHGVLPFAAGAVVDFILAIEDKPKYDPLCLRAAHIERIDAQTTIDYCEYKPVLLVSGRDFLTLVHSRTLNDHSTVVVATSTTHAACPIKEPDVVRGDVRLAGWRIVLRDETSCEVWFYVKTDLCGSIPTRIAHRVLLEQGFGMLDVAKALAKKATEPPRPVAVAPLPPAGAPPVKKTAAPPAPPPAAVAAQDLTFGALASYMALFLLVLYAAPRTSADALLELSHDGVVWVLIAFISLQLYLGPATGNPRRKLMMASWTVPSSGYVYTGVDVDITNSLEHASAENHVALAHVVLAAVGRALHTLPTLNGHIVLGKFYPAHSADVAYLAPGTDGRREDHAQPVTLRRVPQMSLPAIADAVTDGIASLCTDGGLLRKQTDLRLAWAAALPTHALQLGLAAVGWLSHGLGVDCSKFGVPSHMFGQAIVLEMDQAAYVPIAPWMHVPLVVVLGAPKKLPVVLSDDTVAVRTIARLNVTLDPRYVDSADVDSVTRILRDCVSDPRAHLGSVN